MAQTKGCPASHCLNQPLCRSAQFLCCCCALEEGLIRVNFHNVFPQLQYHKESRFPVQIWSQNALILTFFCNSYVLIQALTFLLLPRSSLASKDHSDGFLKHEHLSPLGSKLKFTSSFHTKTTEQLSGSASPQHALLDWNQETSERKALGPISNHTSALGMQHLHHESASYSSCMVQPTAFPTRSKEVLELIHTLSHFCRGGSSRVRAGPVLTATEAGGCDLWVM